MIRPWRGEADKGALTTGTAHGQGCAHAGRLAEMGANIIALGIAAPVVTMSYPLGTREEIEETAALVEAAGGHIVARVADVRDRNAVQVVDGVALDQRRVPLHHWVVLPVGQASSTASSEPRRGSARITGPGQDRLDQPDLHDVPGARTLAAPRH